MKEIRTDKDYLVSLLIKIFLVIGVFWLVVSLVLTLLDSLNLRIVLSNGQDNSVVVFTLFLLTFIISALGAFIYYKLIMSNRVFTMDEKGIKISDGILKKKDVFIEYKNLKDAHCDDDNLAFIDKFFKISVLKIHGNETYYLYGIKNGEEIAKEIKLNIDLNKEKKVEPIDILMEEVKSLKKEIAELKSNIDSLKAKKETKQKPENQKKKRFLLGPFDEKIGE